MLSVWVSMSTINNVSCQSTEWNYALTKMCLYSRTMEPPGTQQCHYLSKPHQLLGLSDRTHSILKCQYQMSPIRLQLAGRLLTTTRSALWVRWVAVPAALPTQKQLLIFTLSRLIQRLMSNRRVTRLRIGRRWLHPKRFMTLSQLMCINRIRIWL